MKPIRLVALALLVLHPPLAAGVQDAGSIGPNNPLLLSAKGELEKANKEVAECEEQLGIRQEDLSHLSGMVAATPEAIRQLAERLQTEKEALEVEMAGAKGREDAITKAIAQTSERVRAGAVADEVTKQIEALVAVRQQSLDRIRQLQATGAAPKAEVEAAEANLATARADLAVAKQKTAGASNDLLEALNRELVNLTISRQERAAKLEFINARLKQLVPALAVARTVERTSHELERAERHRDAAMDQLIAVQRPPRNQ
jgi:chromosome segregation ATPase